MKNEKNYWIVALAVVMFFATMVSAQMTGIRNGFYYFVWMMVGYYGFKGNYDSLKQWMAIIIGLNVFGLCVLFFVGDKDLLFISSGGKWDLVLGVVIMLIPKLVLYIFSKNKIESYKNQQAIDEKKNSINELNASTIENQKQVNVDANHKATIKKESTSVGRTILQDKNTLEPIAEDWESALVEFDDDKKVKGLWAKIFAECNGDENKSKAQYIKIRALEIAALRRKRIDEARANIYAQASNEMCIRNGALTQIEANGTFPIYKLANGNFAIYASWKYKIYSDRESINNALAMHQRCELFSKDGFLEDVAS